MYIELGNINAAGKAKIYDKNGDLLCTCIDTPNAIAFVFSKFRRAYRVVGTYGVPEEFGVLKEFRKDYKSRMGAGNCLTVEDCCIKMAGAKKFLKTPNAKPKTNLDCMKEMARTVVNEDVINAYYSHLV